MRLSFTHLFLLILTGVFNTIGQLLMRWGGNRAASSSTAAHTAGRWLVTSRWWLLGIAVSWLAGIGWAWCLRRLPLGFALPLYTGFVYVLTLLGAGLLLKERLTSIQVLGVAAILCGILLLTASVRLTPNIRAHR